MSVRTQTIQSVLRIEGRQPEEISVWLKPGTTGRSFHCPMCGRFQFHHQHRVVALVEDDMSHVLNQPPIVMQCQKCGTRLHVHIF